MIRIKALTAAALSLASVAIVPSADAQRYYDGGYGYQQPYRGYDQRNYEAGYDQRGYYDGRSYDGRGYYDEGRAYRPCRNGTTGALIGAVVGGLFGNAIAGRHDRGTGLILGAAGGALAGRAVERTGNQGYCR